LRVSADATDEDFPLDKAENFVLLGKGISSHFVL